MNRIDKSNIASEEDQIYSRRQSVPDSTMLQQKIITKTSTLAQLSTSQFSLVDNKKPTKDKLLRFLSEWLSPKTLALTSVAVVGLLIASILISMPALNKSAPARPLIVDQRGSSSFEQTVFLDVKEPMDQLAWEQLWLIQDELAFAEL